MDYKVLVEVNETMVNVDLSISLETDNKVYYYLCNADGEIVAKSGWKRESRYTFDVSELGTNCFFIKAFVLRDEQKYVEKSEWFDYISPDDIVDFHNFCNQSKEYMDFINMDPFHLYHTKHPYSSFCFIMGKYIKEGVSYFCKKCNFEAITYDECILIKEKQIDYKKDKIIFSGIGRIGEKLVVGNSNIGVDEMDTILDSQVGTFTYCKEFQEKIEIGTDYFGTGKIYYFKGESCFACGNNYHMLLMLLKSIAQNLKMNEGVVNALLCKMNQPFSQRFCRECEIENILILPVGKKILVGENVELVDTAISEAFNVDRMMTESEYVELLRKGKEEILANVKAVLDCDQYKEIVMELTGGLDTRIVYAAVTNFDTQNKNIFVNTMEFADLQADIEVATQVNSVYDFPWDNRPRKIKRNTYEDVQNDINSHFLLGGYYYPIDGLPSNYNFFLESLEGEEKAIHLNGYYGEICCRPYFTRSALNRYDDIEGYDLEKLLPIIVPKKDMLSAKMYKALMQVMKKELEQLPGKSYIEKYETEYLFYRNSFHCTKANEYGIRGAWGSIQSKSLYCLCRKMYGRKKDLKVQFDIINELNPILGCIPYGSERDNSAKKRLENDLYYPDEKFRHAVLKLESRREAWEESCHKMYENTEILSGGGKQIQEINEENKQWEEKWEKRFEALLHALMQYKNGILKKQFGVDVFVFSYKKNRVELFKKILYNKLLSIWLQLRIIDNEYNKLFER